MSSRGSVLLYVVFSVLLLSLFAAGIGSRALFALDLSQRLSDQLQSLYLARAAVQVATVILSHDQSLAVDTLQEAWANNPGLFADHRLAEGSFRITAGRTANGEPRYGLQDEERRINMNTAPEEVLRHLMETVGQLPEREVSEVTDAILDWRDPDTDERSHGAERFYYQSLREAYDCKDGPFENVEELLLVRGVSPALYHRLEPWVTVYGSGRINLNTAQEPVLRALGLSATGVSGLLLFRSGEDSAEGTPDDRHLVALSNLDGELKAYVPAEDLATLKTLVQHELLTVHSEAFRMEIQAQTHTPSSRIAALCVLDRQGHIRLWSAW